MKKQKAITRIATLFLQECYPGDLPAHAATQGLDREFRAWFDRRIHDPDVVQLMYEAEIEDFAEELENAFTAPGSGFYSTMHVNPDGTLTRVWSHRGGDRPSSLLPTN
jgi:hypothetical protein